MRVGVLGAGGPAGVNVCRALKAAGHDVTGIDVNPDHRIWVELYADNYSPDLEIPDVWMAQPDSDVLQLAMSGKDHPTPNFLPKPQTVVLCQDKFECGLAWRRAGLRTDAIRLLDDFIPKERFPRWIRGRYGAGGKAAICARNFAEAAHWIGFWNERDVELVAEEFLPGRDFSVCMIWYEGTPLVWFARERLEYLYPNLTPEGITGTPTRAVIVGNADVHDTAVEAVLAVDEQPHGIFCVDLREDSDGIPRPTEINAGRFSTTVGLWSLYSPKTNFVALAAELALADETNIHGIVRLDDWEDLPVGLELSRHIDCGHQFSRVPVPA